MHVVSELCAPEAQSCSPCCMWRELGGEIVRQWRDCGVSLRSRIEIEERQRMIFHCMVLFPERVLVVPNNSLDGNQQIVVQSNLLIFFLFLFLGKNE